MPNPSMLAPGALDDVAPAPAAAPAPRTLGRRRSLPGGRAVIGGFLVTLAAFGIFAAYTAATAPPTSDFAVARRDLPVGTRIEAADVVLLPMELPPELAAGAFPDARRLVGRTVVGPIRKGDLIQGGDVVEKQSGPDEVELSFAVEVDRALAGALGQGEEVDVVATFGSGADALTAVVVRAAKVVTVGPRGGPLDGSDETVTVAVRRREDALALVHAVDVGKVTLVRTSGATAVAPGPSAYQAPRAGRPPS